MTLTTENVYDSLRKVMDPELDHNVVELGLIQDVEIDDGEVFIDLQLTSPHCPFANEIIQRVTQAVMNVEGVKEVSIECPCQGDD
jgi:metal-sulfur cluster biosynthetic enzyme